MGHITPITTPHIYIYIYIYKELGSHSAHVKLTLGSCPGHFRTRNTNRKNNRSRIDGIGRSARKYNTTTCYSISVGSVEEPQPNQLIVA